MTILECSNKLINKIQQLSASIKAKFVSKEAINFIGDLAIVSKRQIKIKANSNDKYLIS